MSSKKISVPLGLILLVAAAAFAQTTATTSTAGTAEVETLQLSGTVILADAPDLLVKMANGDILLFTPPPDRKFIIDGQEVGLSALKPGTKLTSTITQTTTPVVDRTVQSLKGKVWYAAPPTVILTLPGGENRKFVVKHDAPVEFFDANGKKITVFDLKKGMNISATKITEAPRLEFSRDIVVTGTAPVAAPEPKPAPVAAPAPEPQPAPAPAPEPVPAPAELPKTGSSLPLVGLLGLLLTGAGLAVRRFLR